MFLEDYFRQKIIIMNKYINLCFLLLFALSVSAQNPKKYVEKSDPEAKKILEKLADAYDTDGGIYLKYKLTLEFGKDKEIQSGDIYQKGGKYHLVNNGNLIISDGKSVWVYNKKQNECQINDFDPDGGEMLSPGQILDIHNSNEYFYAITGENSQGYKIEFKPLDKDSEIMKIRIEVDKSKTKLKSAKIFSDDGSRYTFDIEKLENKKVSDSKFTFDKSKYPGVTVIDLRE